jgi:hypothetical protein
MPDITQIMPPRVPIVDERTGLISREWYRFFFNQFEKVGSSSQSLEDIQLDILVQQQPDLSTVDPTPALLSAYAVSSALESQFAEMQKQIQAADLSSEGALMALQAQLANLFADVQGLALSPPVTPQLKRARYGSFYDTTTQTATTINTAKAITFNTTDLSNGVYIGSPTSRIYVDTPGIYNYDMSFQLDKTSGGVGNFYIWFRLNGVDVANSASYIQIQGNNHEIFSSLNYFFDLNVGDYVEIMFSVSTLSVELAAFAAAAPVPAIPSIILTVANNIEGAST